MLFPPPSRSAARLRERRARRGSRRRGVATVVAAVAGSLVGASSALASWTAAGDGLGDGSVAGADVRVVVAEPDADLLPGAPGQAVPVTLANDAPTAYRVTSIVPTVGALPEGCPTDSLTLGLLAPLPVVPAGGSAIVEVRVAMPSDAADACQGATVRLSVAVAGRHQ